MIVVIEQHFKFEDTAETLKRNVEGVIEQVENSSVEDFIENVLDITRVATLVNGKWETQEYKFCIGYGGPGIWLTTNGLIEGYWASEKYVIKCDNQRFMEKLKEIEDYLDEIYG